MKGLNAWFSEGKVGDYHGLVHTWLSKTRQLNFQWIQIKTCQNFLISEIHFIYR